MPGDCDASSVLASEATTDCDWTEVEAEAPLSWGLDVSEETIYVFSADDGGWIEFLSTESIETTCADGETAVTESSISMTCVQEIEDPDYPGEGYNQETFISMSWSSDYGAPDPGDDPERDPDSCTDTAGDATDSYGDGCEWYDEYPEECGAYDDEDFTAAEVCCACGRWGVVLTHDP